MNIDNSIANTVLKFLDCIEVDNDTTVVASFAAISCRSDQYKSLVPLFLVLLIAVVVCAPFIMLITLICLKRRMMLMRLTPILGIVYDVYRRDRYWWEFVVLLRRVALLGITVLLRDDRKTMLSILTVTNIAVLCAHMLASPYHTHYDNRLESMSLMLLAVVTAVLTPIPLPLTTAQSLGISLTVLIPTLGFLAMVAFSRGRTLAQQLARYRKAHGSINTHSHGADTPMNHTEADNGGTIGPLASGDEIVMSDQLGSMALVAPPEPGSPLSPQTSDPSAAAGSVRRGSTRRTSLFAASSAHYSQRNINSQRGGGEGGDAPKLGPIISDEESKNGAFSGIGSNTHESKSVSADSHHADEQSNAEPGYDGHRPETPTNNTIMGVPAGHTRSLTTVKGAANKYVDAAPQAHHHRHASGSLPPLHGSAHGNGNGSTNVSPEHANRMLAASPLQAVPFSPSSLNSAPLHATPRSNHHPRSRIRPAGRTRGPPSSLPEPALQSVDVTPQQPPRTLRIPTYHHDGTTLSAPSSSAIGGSGSAGARMVIDTPDSPMVLGRPRKESDQPEPSSP
jgi:hypothetical protein